MSWKTLRKLWPSRNLVARLVPPLALIVVAMGAYVMGRFVAPQAHGQSAQPIRTKAAAPDGDYNQRVVAWVYDTIPITREELGEFLIQRFGADRLETLVNRRIVELACKAKGIEVSDSELEFQFRNELKAISPQMTVKDFENHILNRFKKNLVEWKEDAIRPKMMLAKYVRSTVEVTEEDIRKGFEGRYGPKVECRMVVLPDDNNKSQMWHRCNQSEEEFVRVATTHNMGQLNSVGGKVPAIHKHFGDATIERIAFGLQVGQVSALIGMPDRTVIILKCDRHIPPDVSKKLEDVRLELREEIFSIKLNQKVPEMMAQLRREANPKVLLRNETRQEDLERSVLPEINRGGAKAPVAAPGR